MSQRPYTLGRVFRPFRKTNALRAAGFLGDQIPFFSHPPLPGPSLRSRCHLRFRSLLFRQSVEVICHRLFPIELNTEKEIALTPSDQKSRFCQISRSPAIVPSFGEFKGLHSAVPQEFTHHVLFGLTYHWVVRIDFHREQYILSRECLQ